MSGERGIDVSHWQGSPDYRRVAAAGYRYVIAKATDGTRYGWTTWYAEQARLIREAGLVQGAYHWLNGADPLAQARFFCGIVGDFTGKIAALDVEDDAATIAHVRGFVAEFRRLRPGKRLLIYTGRWFWRDTLGNPTGSDLGPLWHSEYEPSEAEVADGPEAGVYGGWAGPTLWQFTSSGAVPGVAGRCDVNKLLRGTIADLVRVGTTTPPRPAPSPPTTTKPPEDYVLPPTLNLRKAHLVPVRDPQSAIKKLQGLLLAHGYPADALTGPSGHPDGVAGAGTRDSVLAFQKGHGLVADAVVGVATWRALIER